MSKSQRKAFIAGSPADGSNLLRSELIDQHENFEKQTTKSNLPHVLHEDEVEKGCVVVERSILSGKTESNAN